MTIAISLKVNDGVVLAADSASTIIALSPGGELFVRNVYTNADKIFNLCKGWPIGAITWGVGSIGQESIATLIKDFRERLTGNDAQQDEWKLRDTYQLRSVAEKLREFIFDEKYQPAFKEWATKPDLGFLVAGFSPKQSLAEEYQIEIKNGECSGPYLVRAQTEWGIRWNGEPEAINRLVLGFSSGVLNVLAEQFQFDDKKRQLFIQQMSGKYAAQFVIDAMPIKDAINLAEFLVETTIKYSRYSSGPTTVDGPVEIAAITKHEGFKWIKRKYYYSAELNPTQLPSRTQEESDARISEQL